MVNMIMGVDPARKGANFTAVLVPDHGIRFAEATRLVDRELVSIPYRTYRPFRKLHEGQPGTWLVLGKGKDK